MPSCWATRRASSTSATLQQPVSLAPPHSRMVTPTTSCPCCCRSAAATEESTPPDIATNTFTSDKATGRPADHPPRSAAELGEGGGDRRDGVVDVGLGRG